MIKLLYDLTVSRSAVIKRFIIDSTRESGANEYLSYEWGQHDRSISLRVYIRE